MSFSAQTKTELCAIPVSRDCCAVAEAYGLLLFAHTFSHTEIAVVTANEALAKRVPPLLTRAFSASVQSQEKGAGGRVTLKIAAALHFCAAFFWRRERSQDRTRKSIWSWRHRTMRCAAK